MIPDKFAEILGRADHDEAIVVDKVRDVGRDALKHDNIPVEFVVEVPTDTYSKLLEEPYAVEQSSHVYQERYCVDHIFQIRPNPDCDEIQWVEV